MDLSRFPIDTVIQLTFDRINLARIATGKAALAARREESQATVPALKELHGRIADTESASLLNYDSAHHSYQQLVAAYRAGRTVTEQRLRSISQELFDDFSS